MSTWHSWAGASCVDAIARLISQEYRRKFLALVDSIWIPNARKNRNASRSGSRVLWGFKIQNPPREFPGGWRSAESVMSLAHPCHEGMVVTIESLEWRSGSLENLTIRCPSDLRDDASFRVGKERFARFSLLLIVRHGTFTASKVVLIPILTQGLPPWNLYLAGNFNSSRWRPFLLGRFWKHSFHAMPFLKKSSPSHRSGLRD